MTKRIPLICFLIPVFCLLAANPAWTQESTDGTLHVVRPIMDAVQDTAGLCLEFDHALDITNRSAILSHVRLEADGKNQPLTAATFSLAPRLLCFQSLQYRQNYSVTVTALKGAQGEKLTEPYRFSFTVPDRAPLLAFSGETGGEKIARYADSNPVLRTVNIPRVHLALYRLTDSAAIAAAWQQRLQTTLAPAESLYLAKALGERVWEGDMALKDVKDDRNANRNQEYLLPLRAAAAPLGSGFYLIAATAPRAENAPSELAPMAAEWFLRSDLRIDAVTDSEGIHASATNATRSDVVKDARLILLGRDQKTIGEMLGDADGLAFLPLPPDQQANAAVLIGVTAAGDVDVTDFSSGAIETTLPNLVTACTPDRSAYPPGAEVRLRLSAHNLANQPVSVNGSRVQLLWPDRHTYAAWPVADGADGVSTLSFPAPLKSGNWVLQWQAAEGKILAEPNLRVSARADAPHLEIAADRATLDAGGEASLTINSRTGNGGVAPYVGGSVTLQWTEAEKLADWPDYRFGSGETHAHEMKPPQRLASFLTDARGTARLTLALPAPDDAATLTSATLAARAADADSLDAEPLALPHRPPGIAIGVKPLAPDGKFAENSLAKFDLVAVDENGQRRALEDLEYQIFEEGRSFDWYQAEGRWDYKPLPQRRRIGGGALTIKATGTTLIDWPVTAGSYTLDITDADGNLLARSRFDAGWNLPRAAAPADLHLSPEVGADGIKVKFTLKAAGVIRAVIADDRVRRVIHEARAAGANEIAFAPPPEWGARLRISLSAGNEAGAVEVSRTPPQQTAAVSPEAAAPKPNAPLAAVPFTPPADERYVSEASQTLGAQQSWQAPPPAKGVKNRATYVLLGAAPLEHLPEALQALIGAAPFETSALGEWLQAARLWEKEIDALRLMPRATWQARIAEQAARLVARQNPDGGLPAQPGGVSDAAATANALAALHQTGAAAELAFAQAVDYLHRQLENTWFEERERPARAAMFAALAAAGRLDVSALRYFAETSADKNLPPLAAAQLASALSAGGERDKAAAWLAKIGEIKDIALAPVLAQNSLFNADEIQPVLVRFAKETAGDAAQDTRTIAALLRAWRSAMDRKGNWRAVVNGEDKTQGGFMVLAVPEKNAALSIRNPADVGLTVLPVRRAAAFAKNSGITRRIVRPDGGAAEIIAAGEVYAVELSGTFPRRAADEFVLQDFPAPALTPVTCALKASAGSVEGWQWPNDNSPAAPIACEKTSSGIALLLRAGEAREWRAVYLARALREGNFTLPAATLQNVSGENRISGGSRRIEIR